MKVIGNSSGTYNVLMRRLVFRYRDFIRIRLHCISVGCYLRGRNFVVWVVSPFSGQFLPCYWAESWQKQLSLLGNWETQGVRKAEPGERRWPAAPRAGGRGISKTVQLGIYLGWMRWGSSLEGGGGKWGGPIRHPSSGWEAGAGGWPQGSTAQLCVGALGAAAAANVLNLLFPFFLCFFSFPSVIPGCLFLSFSSYFLSF